MLRSDLCDFSDAYIAAKGTVTVERNNAAKTRNKKLIFKSNAPFRSCISKINNTFIDNAEDLDIAMPMYNLLEYSDNYSITSGSLRNYYRDGVNDNVCEKKAARIKINNNKTITGKSCECKTELIGSTPNNNKILGAEGVAPLRYLSNFWRSLDLRLINGETELYLPWSKECILSEISVTPAIAGNPPNRERQTTGATFQINNAKLYVPVFTLFINDNIKFV